MKMLFLGVIVAALGLSSCETPVGQGAGYGAAGGAIIGGLAGGTVRSAAIGAAAGAATGALIGAIVQEISAIVITARRLREATRTGGQRENRGSCGALTTLTL